MLRAGVVGAALAGEVEGVERARILTPGAEPRLEATGDPRELVVVDQFEELYTLCEDPARRDAFIDGLLALPSPVVIGVRADLYGRLSDHAELARAVADNQILLGAMGDEELERAITEPARVAGLRLEPGLVELILRDVAREPGALPLLSHALRVTWEQRDGRTLTVEGYRASGGVASAIAQTADSVVEAVPPDRQGLMRNLFLRLTELGEGIEDTRRRVAVEELVPEGASPEEVQALLDRLAEARLVTLGEGTAEVAHEVLIREWPTLRAWLEEDRAGIRLHRRAGRRGPPLGGGGPGGRRPLSRHEARRGGGMGAVAPGRAERHRARVPRRERRGVGARAPHAAPRQPAVARAARRRRPAARRRRDRGRARAARRATDARDSARTADAQRLGAQALIDDRLDRSLLLAQAGRELDDSVATRGYLLSALVRRPAAIGVMQGDGDPLFALALSPGGRMLAAGDDNGTVVLLDTRTRERIGGPLQLNREVGEPRLLAGRQAARSRGSGGRGAGRPEREARRRRHQEGGPQDRCRTLSVRPRGVRSGRRCPLRRRRSDRPRERHAERAERGLRRTCDGTTRAPAGPWDPAFASAGGPRARPRRFPPGATACSSSGLTTRSWSTRQRCACGGGSRWACSAPGLSPDGRSAALGGEDGSVAILDLRTGERRTLTGRHEDRVRALAFSADGRTLATTADDGRVLVWDLRSGEVRETLTGHTGAVNTLEVSDDGRTLYTAGLDGRIIVWDIAGDRRLARPFRGGRSELPVIRRRSRSVRPAGRLPPGSPTAACACTTRAPCAASATCRGSRTDPWPLSSSAPTVDRSP